MRPVTNSYDFWTGLGDTARVILLLGHAVYNILLLRSLSDAWFVNGADDVDLIVLPRVIAAVDVDDIVCSIDAKYGVGGIPMDIMHSRRICCGGHMQQTEDHEGGISLLRHVGCRPTHPF